VNLRQQHGDFLAPGTVVGLEEQHTFSQIDGADMLSQSCANQLGPDLEQCALGQAIGQSTILENSIQDLIEPDRSYFTIPLAHGSLMKAS